MTVAVDDVLGWDLTGLPAAASSLTALTGRLIDTGRTCERSASSDREWRGVTAVAARTRIGAATASIIRTAHTVDDAAESMRTAHTELADLQTVLRSAVDGLRADRYLVAPDGIVSIPIPITGRPRWTPANRSRPCSGGPPAWIENTAERSTLSRPN